MRISRSDAAYFYGNHNRIFKNECEFNVKDVTGS